MRPVLVVLLLILVGCLASEEPRNPMKRPATDVAPVASKNSEVAPVASKDAPEQVEPDEAPESEQDLMERLGEMDKVSLMKEMFLLQLNLTEDAKELIEARDELNTGILNLSKELTQKQMDEFNLWLRPYGVQIERRRKARSKPSKAF